MLPRHVLNVFAAGAQNTSSIPTLMILHTSNVYTFLNVYEHDNVNRLKHKGLKFSNILPTKQPDQQMFLIMHAHFKEKKQSEWDSQVCKKVHCG